MVFTHMYTFLALCVNLSDWILSGMSGSEVLSKVEKGYRMPKPSGGAGCSDAFYEIMEKCWLRSAERRPTFAFLHSFFDDYFINTEPNYQGPDDWGKLTSWSSNKGLGLSAGGLFLCVWSCEMWSVVLSFLCCVVGIVMRGWAVYYVCPWQTSASLTWPHFFPITFPWFLLNPPLPFLILLFLQLLHFTNTPLPHHHPASLTNLLIAPVSCSNPPCSSFTHLLLLQPPYSLLLLANCYPSYYTPAPISLTTPCSAHNPYFSYNPLTTFYSLQTATPLTTPLLRSLLQPHAPLTTPTSLTTPLQPFTPCKLLPLLLHPCSDLSYNPMLRSQPLLILQPPDSFYKPPPLTNLLPFTNPLIILLPSTSFCFRCSWAVNVYHVWLHDWYFLIRATFDFWKGTKCRPRLNPS